MRLLRSSSVTPNCAPSRRICWHRAQLRGGAVLAAAGQADAPGSNRRARPLRRLCGSRAQTSPHRPKGPRRRRGCNRREPAVPDAARGDRPRPALAPRRASRACYRLPSFARKAGRSVSPGCERPSAPPPRARSGRAARVAGRCRRAAASWQSESAEQLAPRPAPARASESERARPNGGPGIVADGVARAGCGSGQAWLLGPFGSRAPGTGPVVISLARSAIRSPHLGPIVRSGSGRLRGFCDTRPGSIEAPRHLRRCSDRGATSSVGVQRGAPTGRGPLGLRLGLYVRPWRAAARFVARLATEIRRCAGSSCDGETRTRTGDATIFSSC